MARFKSYTTRTMCLAASLSAAALLALPAATRAQADTRPVVVVFTFTNSSIGTGKADFDGMSTGVQDLLITDLASNAKIRLVDRARIAEVEKEQNMVKGGEIDQATAVRIGRIMGAQYAITGSFMSDGRGNAMLTAHTIDMETTQIGNPQKIQGKSDDVFGVIGQLSTKLSGDMNLAPKPGRRVGDAGTSTDSKTPAQQTATATQQSKTAAPTVETFAKGISEKSMQTKLDLATMKVYSNALDEIDKGNKAKAKQLLQQVVDKYQAFEPAQNQLKKLG